MRKLKSPGVIKAIFVRNGDEGEHTKLITEENEGNYAEQLSELADDEKGLIICRKSNTDWTLLTTQRLISVKNDSRFAIARADIREVRLAMKEEHENLGKSPLFTRLALTTSDGNRHVVPLEPGRAFSAFAQVLYRLP
jgi:hypothetical protein